MTWGDLFCGGGGTTSGAYSVPGVKVIWALNHSKSAIATHQANHPETLHYQSDILVQDEHDLAPVDGIWMSSECTNHSIAKGGKLLDLGSRSLPMELVRFARHCEPSVIIVENVREFVNWGPLVNGRPDKKRKGETFNEWVEAIRACGYPNYEHRFLNAADFGAHTSRTRYFGIFTKAGVPVQFPEATHSKTGANGLTKWRACREILDLDNHGQSVWEKKLCPNTIKRLIGGLIKFGGDPTPLYSYPVYGNVHDCTPAKPDKDVQLQISYSAKKEGEFRGQDLDNPIKTLDCSNRMALETQKRQFIMKYGYHNPNNVQSLDDPCATLITTENQVLVTQFMTSAYTSSGKPETNIKSIDDPIGTIPCKDIHALVTQSQFIMSNYSTDKPEHMAHTIENPIPTLTTSNAHSIVSQIGGDIKIRFISVQEAKELQGFPADYKLVGNKAEQLRHIGNAVVPIMAKCLIEANYIETHDPLLSIMPGEMYEVCGEYEQQELAWR